MLLVSGQQTGLVATWTMWPTNHSYYLALFRKSRPCSWLIVFKPKTKPSMVSEARAGLLRLTSGPLPCPRRSGCMVVLEVWGLEEAEQCPLVVTPILITVHEISSESSGMRKTALCPATFFKLYVD